ncbi:MAG: hypothetical protein KAI75_05935 [Desulfobulbaceae bacterium]|nr:hypothetical protein [Desulfobulbaceae bacterium]
MKRVLVLMVFWLSFCGCAQVNTSGSDMGCGPSAGPEKLAMEGDMGALALSVRDLTVQLHQNAQEESVREYVVAVSTFVNLNTLYRTSSFGRYLSEQMMNELQKSGVEVIDVRKTPGLQIYEKFGEYSLSRNMEDLSFTHPAQAVISGTYTYVENQIFVNVRLLRTSDGMVLSSGSLTLPLDAVTGGLLSDEAEPGTVNKPVRIREFAEKEEE